MKARGVTFGRWSALLAVLLALMLGFGLWGTMSPTAQAVGEPQPGTMQRALTHTLVDGEVLITATVYSDAPLPVGSDLDVSRISNWHSADVFVTVDISGTATLTATVQTSPDQTNWADAYYVYPSWNSTGTATLNTQPYRLVMSADGTNYLRVPLTGEYMRVKLEPSGTVTNVITATVQATLRND